MTDRTNQLIDSNEVAQAVRHHPHGNAEPRGLSRVSSIRKPDDGGRFGRIFSPGQKQPDQSVLERLGNPAPEGSGLMVDAGQVGDSPIPAGYTYLGQFIDHDITFDPTSSLDKQNDPHALNNFRTPRMDLDSLYMGGPSDSVFLYDQNDSDLFALGPSLNSGAFAHQTADAAGDLPRNSQNVAIIGDPRNDENLVVAQIHRQFLKFHNRVVKWVRTQNVSPALTFITAQQLVRWHYQWVIVHDYLPRIAGPEVVADILKRGRAVYKFSKRPYMPVEFSVAAFRFGHSMVRDSYPRFQIAPRPFTQATLGQLFQFTHTNVTAVNWILHPDDWSNLFETNAAITPVMARAIDARLSPSLARLPNLPPNAGPKSLATRNLIRAKTMNIPSGQTVAALIAKSVKGIKPLQPSEIAGTDPSGFLESSGLAKNTPLWYYVLLEAQLREDGARLGPVGGRLVAEVIIGLLQGDADSYLKISSEQLKARVKKGPPLDARDLNQLVRESRATAAGLSGAVSRDRPPVARPTHFKAARWTPVLPASKPGTFTMADLIRFASS